MPPPGAAEAPGLDATPFADGGAADQQPDGEAFLDVPPDMGRAKGSPFSLARVSRSLSVDLDAQPLKSLPPGAPLPPTPSALQGWEARIDDALTVARLAARLYRHLWFGLAWWVRFWRLVAFAALLTPGFAQMAAFYALSPRVLRSVPYGGRPRNRLDVYLPRAAFRRPGRPPAPVVVYVTGGAWTIGYKAWGALIARRLSQRGVLVLCLDYRNFPQGDVPDMLADVNAGVAWALANAAAYGGDPARVWLVGQSAGAHLTSLALLAQAEAAARGGGGAAVLGASPRWDVGAVRGYLGVSGTYDVEGLAGHLHARGLYRGLLTAMMSVGGAPALRALSPTHVAARLPAAAAAALPPVTLLHGTADASVPVSDAERFAAVLRAAGGRARLKAYAGKTHTQPIIEDPMRGGRDVLMDEVLELVTGRPHVSRQFAMCPALLLDLGSAVCPF